MARVYGYHTVELDWRRTGPVRPGNLVGLELEVYHGAGNNVGAEALADFPRGDYPRPIAEIDGSLDRQLGFEIILPPLPAEDVLNDKGYVGNLLDALQRHGVREGGDGYGMHVNINVAEWSEPEKMAVTYLLNSMGPATSAVASRRPAPTCRLFPRFYFRFARTPRGDIITKTQHDTTPPGKYAAAWLRPGRNVLEFRAPKALLDMAHVRKCVEYVYAVLAWVRHVGPLRVLSACYLSSLATTEGTCYALTNTFTSFTRKSGLEISKHLPPRYPKAPGTMSGARESWHEHFTRAQVHSGTRTQGGMIYDNSDIAKQAFAISSILSKGGSVSARITDRGFLASSAAAASD